MFAITDTITTTAPDAVFQYGHHIAFDAGRHAVVDPAVNVETYGKALLGVDDHITALL